ETGTSLPAWIDEVAHGRRGLVLLHLVGVVENHARSSRKAGPVAIRVAIARGNAVGAWRPIRFEKSLFLQDHCPQRLVGPEDIRLGSVALGNNSQRDAGALRLLRVVDGANLDATRLLKVLQHRLGEHLVLRGIDDDLGARAHTLRDGEGRDEQSNETRALTLQHRSGTSDFVVSVSPLVTSPSHGSRRT